MEKARRKISQWCFIDYSLVREGMAEFIGTAFLLALGDGSVAQKVLSKGDGGTILSINLSWGFAVAIAVYISGGVSGGHINPAISLTMWVLGRISVLKLIVYSICQYLGALFGAALVYAIYYDALNNFDGGVRMVQGVNATAGIFATYPQPYLSTGGGLGDQMFGTCILAISVLAITDPRNMEVSKCLVPLLVGLVVALIGMTYGLNCGYAINPARDLGPRIFTAFAGWGVKVFSHRNYNWFWVPIVGPYVGAVLGGLSYMVTIGNHWPQSEKKEPERTTSSRHSSLDVNVSTAEARRLSIVSESSFSTEQDTTGKRYEMYFANHQDASYAFHGATIAAAFGAYFAIRTIVR